MKITDLEEYLKERALECKHKGKCMYKEECTPPQNLDSCGIYHNWDNLDLY